MPDTISVKGYKHFCRALYVCTREKLLKTFWANGFPFSLKIFTKFAEVICFFFAFTIFKLLNKLFYFPSQESGKVSHKTLRQKPQCFSILKRRGRYKYGISGAEQPQSCQHYPLFESSQASLPTNKWLTNKCKVKIYK